MCSWKTWYNEPHGEEGHIPLLTYNESKQSLRTQCLKLGRTDLEEEGGGGGGVGGVISFTEKVIS